MPDAVDVGRFADHQAFRAVALSPGNVLSLQALAAVSYYRGEYDEAERLQREALALNPNDPETLAQLGWRLAFRGRWEEGARLPCASPGSAVMLTPAWYHTSFAMHAYLGKYAEALAYAEKSRPTDSGIGLSLYAMTQAAMGDEGEARKALDELAARLPHFLRDPAARLSHTPHRRIRSSSTSSMACARPAGRSLARQSSEADRDEQRIQLLRRIAVFGM